MTTDEIIDGLLTREGGWRDAVQRPDGTWDPATNKGITLPTLKKWRGRRGMLTDIGHLRDLTDAEARAIYQYEYIDKPGFTKDAILFEPLRAQLVDFGVNSGPDTAIRWLQRVLRFYDDDVDGILGPQTLGVLHQWSGIGPNNTLGLALVNDALVAARSYMIDRLEDTGKLRPQDEEGVESRALSFFLARP